MSPRPFFHSSKAFLIAPRLEMCHDLITPPLPAPNQLNWMQHFTHAHVLDVQGESVGVDSVIGGNVFGVFEAAGRIVTSLLVSLH